MLEVQFLSVFFRHYFKITFSCIEKNFYFIILGVKVLFKVAVVLVNHVLGSREQRKEFGDFHSIVTRLKNLPEQITSEELFIDKVRVLIFSFCKRIRLPVFL